MRRRSSRKRSPWRSGSEPDNQQRDQRGPERRQVQDRRDDDRMGVAEAELVEQEAAHPDREDDRQIAVIGGFSEQRDEIAAAAAGGRQQRNRHQQRELGQEHKLQGIEMLGRRKRKRLLGRVQEGGDDRIEASEPVVDRGAGRLHRRDAFRSREICEQRDRSAAKPRPRHRVSKRPYHIREVRNDWGKILDERPDARSSDVTCGRLTEKENGSGSIK